MFQGSCVALVTPMKDGRIDEEKLRELVEWHVREGTQALVPCGSTGEAATLKQEEYLRVLRAVVDQSKKRLPVIAGVSGNATWKVSEIFQEVAGLGVDAALVLVPYYNKPTQGGLLEHFKVVARSAKLPIVVYNIPGRTGVNLLPATLVRLARECSNIVAVKEASGNLDQVSEIVGTAPSGFVVLSGDDSLTLPMMSVGARGVVSVVANILPKDTSQLCRAYLDGCLQEAQKLHGKLYPVIKALFIETNPIPVKAAMEFLGLCRSEIRLPLTPLSPESQKKLVPVLEDYGLKVRKPSLAVASSAIV